MYGLYRNITRIVAPLLPWWLEKRRAKGKEHVTRINERFGQASIARPEGKLLWVHAASVGESNAALPLIETLLAANTALHVLLTTGTVTSAALMEKRLPPRALHQFVPVDTPKAVEAFIDYWKPQMALFVDSELWPNLIVTAQANGAVLGLVNARMSESSYKSWQWGRGLIHACLSRFTYCFAQSKDSAYRLKLLGVPAIDHIGNLKYDVPALPCDEAELERLRVQIGARPVWVAASTHAGEEEQIIVAHRELKKTLPELLTIIVPRHAVRAEEILQKLQGLSVVRRSLNAPIVPDTELYLADTMGELGLFYRLAQVAFIGGSLVPHGGQNPIEALQLGCPVILGANMQNFASIALAIENEGACLAVKDSATLAAAVAQLLTDAALRESMSQAGRRHVQMSAGTLAAIVKKLQPSLAI